MNTNINYSDQLKALSEILADGEKYGLDFSQLIKQIRNLRGNANDDVIRIVLISAFSDGKTSTIAGLLGHVENNMKIDSDESSDEIIVYHPKGLKHGYEIVDTPGLFGTKEKEIDGESIRFSEITEKYISQAHLIIYVCDAVTPLKQSHAHVIEKLLRTFNKLESTIFVINKMDETGADLTDSEEYASFSKIKINNLKQRLRDTISLTKDEEAKLHIVCIAAAPKGKNIEKWKGKENAYYERSHIEDLRKEVNAIVDRSDATALISATHINTLVDLTTQATQAISIAKTNLKDSIDKAKDKENDIDTDMALLKKEISNAKNEMQRRLNELENSLIKKLKSATPSNISDILEMDLGTRDGQLTFYKMERGVKAIVDECSEANNASLGSHIHDIENAIAQQDTFIQQGLSKMATAGTKLLKSAKFTGESVKAIRNVVASSYKFKPWGAINLAAKLNKALPWIGAGLEVVIEAVSAWRDQKRQKEFEEAKSSIKDCVKKFIDDVMKTFENDQDYYKNYAPSYLQLLQQLKERQAQYAGLIELNNNFDAVHNRLSKWLQSNAEDAKFEEININSNHF